jgi:hypothetical protein
VTHTSTLLRTHHSLILLLKSSLLARFPFHITDSYQQELPTRFKKDIVKAALSNKQSDLVGLDGMQRVLTNIGAESRISDGDMQLIFKELGNEAGKIPINRLVQIL